MTSRRTFDAIVVGSGITGGLAAKELTERGLETLVLEAGGSFDPHHRGNAPPPAWQRPFLERQARKELAIEQFVQRRCYACRTAERDLFVNDRDNPYTTDPEHPFVWIRGRQVGGRSLTWAGWSYRWSDLDFEANLRDGIGVDWPIRYRDVAPWYDYVERLVGITGEANHLAHLPDSCVLPPMPLNVAERYARAKIEAAYGAERMLIPGRCALMTVAPPGGTTCHHPAPKRCRCVLRPAFSSLTSTLPAAARTGRLYLRPYSIGHSLVWDRATRRVTAVRVIDARTRETVEVRGRVVLLCASALESTRILLNSASPDWPTGLANSSGELGRNLMDHVTGAGAAGELPALGDLDDEVRPFDHVYIPRFRNVRDRAPGFVRGYAFQGRASRRRVSDARFVRYVPGHWWSSQPHDTWELVLKGYGESLPSRENYVELDPTVVDAWGVPVLRIHCSRGGNEWAMLDDMADTAQEILEAAGAVNIRPIRTSPPPGSAIHEMGTARMGRDPRTSVLNRWNQSHDVPNLFVTDGACMTSSACQNPSITYMALTARACAYAVRQLARGEL
jgi:choline dehydrogenase-like flavoprotein